jgi:hypothetical protein
MSNMKIRFYALVITAVLFAASSQCLAFVRVEHVSKERAKQLGVTLRSSPSGTNEVAVRLEFKTQGELKDFGRAVLEVGAVADGETRALSATLLPDYQTPDTVVLSFSADLATLPKCVLTIMVRGGPRAKSDAYAFRMRDFIKPDELH